MSAEKFIGLGLNLFQHGEDILALAQICHALEYTAKREYPLEDKVGSRFKKLIMDNRRLIFAIITDFHMIPSKNGGIRYSDEKGKLQDLSYFIYKLIRCSLVHEANVAENFELIDYGIFVLCGNGGMKIHRNVVLALAIAVIAQRCNSKLDLNLRIKIRNNTYTIHEIAGIGGDALADKLIQEIESPQKSKKNASQPKKPIISI